ncbi:uncharacterized protein N7515_008400 [Penicillium bovifimosum]|uniref:Uncharacterized protein n=1 Tax=Penicillium bovifimosum TaxID=126998 RepID=A0A9W9GPG2_9EURO|nr:uncharacterized protein N7515_008400 [Penicillium bovifimosum]KAJ5124575.1 hypothetical protein N7515_008400 [Penicillium bovifimosum]
MSYTFTEHTHGTDVATMFPDRVKGKTFVIAGLKRGDLAATTADALAHGGAGTIIFTGHSQPELQPVIDHITRKHKDTKMVFITADSGSLTSFRDAAYTIKSLGISIDGFVGFPEVMAVPWELTEDGHESHFQRNYLCHFLLLNMLRSLMPRGSRAVLVTTSIRSEAPAPTWDDMAFSNGEQYHALEGYSQSMLAVIMFVKSFAKKYSDRSIAAFSANPGNTKTNVQTHVALDEITSWLQRKKEEGKELPVLLQQVPRSLAQGSATVVRGLLDPELEGKIGTPTHVIRIEENVH